MGRPWSRITIVTPSYQQGHFIEETIRSVLLQGYPDLEYIIIDGASTDASVDIIRKYADWLTSWVSEPDRGQAHAINKGFSRTTGALLAWLNSDDLLLPQALRLVSEAHLKDSTAILLGDVEEFFDAEGRSRIIRQSNVTFRSAAMPWEENYAWHPSGMFVPRPLFASVGPLDEQLRYVFDHDWLCRLLQRATVSYLCAPVARFRIHGLQKTTAEVPTVVRESLQVIQRYWDEIPDLDKQYVRALYGVREAGTYLGYHPSYIRFWDRSAGIRLLLSTWLRYPRILTHPDFRRLCLRAVLPVCMLRSSPWRTPSP